MNELERKTTLTVYGALSANKERSAGFQFYTIAKYFLNKGKLEKVICLGVDNDIDIDDSLIRSPGLLFKVATKLIGTIGPWLPGNQVRFLRETLFDLFCSRHVRCQESQLLLNLKPLVPVTVRQARRNNCRYPLKVVTLATTAHPRFNFNIIKQLQDKYSLPDRSTYTNERRVRRMEDMLQQSDKVLLMVKSQFIYDTYRQHGVDENKISFLGNSSAGVDTKVFVPSRTRKTNDMLVFLTLGNLTLIKGTPLLLDAWELVQRDESIRARLILSGKTDADFEVLLKKRGWDNLDGLRTTGFVNDLVTAYQEADVFIAASVSDNGPATLLEAMSCGLPVIASRNCGFSEFIRDGIEGFIYDPLDTNALKDKIAWFSANQDMIPEMGQRARQRAKDFQVQDYIEQVYSACYPEGNS